MLTVMNISLNVIAGHICGGVDRAFLGRHPRGQIGNKNEECLRKKKIKKEKTKT